MKKRLIFICLAAVLLAAFTAFGTYAAPTDETDRIYSIARDGDCLSFPAGSVQAVKGGAALGVDAVSVGIQKTADGVLVTLRSDNLSETFPGITGKVSETDYKTLSAYRLRDFEGTETEYGVATLEQVLGVDTTLILDGQDYRDEIAAEVKRLSAENKVKLRMREKGASAAAWSSENGIDVIGIYYGNIIFSAASHIKALSDVPGRWVQLQSGNFFSVLYNNYIMKKCAGLSVKPVCAMYDADLCGNRTDTTQGFDDIISRGFSVIETNQPALLVKYIAEVESSNTELSVLKEKALAALANGEYSLTSAERLSRAAQYADTVLNKNPSRLETEKACAGLLEAVKALSPPDGKDMQKNSLNVTPGKVIAVVIFGSLVIAAQVYVHKKKRK